MRLASPRRKNFDNRHALAVIERRSTDDVAGEADSLARPVAGITFEIVSPPGHHPRDPRFMSSALTGPEVAPGRKIPTDNPAPGAYFALAVLFTMNLLNYVDRYVFAAVGESIKKDLELTDFKYGILAGAFMVVYTILSPVIGVMGDRYSRRKLVAFGVGLWSVATVGTTFSADFYRMLRLASPAGSRRSQLRNCTRRRYSPTSSRAAFAVESSAPSTWHSPWAEPWATFSAGSSAIQSPVIGSHTS